MEQQNTQSYKIETEKEYLNDSYKFEADSAILIAVEDFPKDPNSFSLIFNKTIFHPQGGGQPSDEGVIENIEKGVKLNIEALAFDREREVVLHKISRETFNSSGLSVGDTFNMKINEEKRKLYARLHSAGHLLDLAVGRLNLNLVPGKGYHFPDGPYVEYSGNIDKTQINDLSRKIEEISNEIIQNSKDEDSAISKFYSYEEGKNSFPSIPSYLPEGKPFRWVKLLPEDLGCPCGGTHVKHVRDINKMKITKITNKGKIVRVSYGIL